jgi:hypothetical protein
VCCVVWDTVALLECGKDPRESLSAYREGTVQEIEDGAANFDIVDDVVVTGPIANHHGNRVCFQRVEDLLDTSCHGFRSALVQSTLELTSLDALLEEVLETLVGVTVAMMRRRNKQDRKMTYTRLLSHCPE